MASTDIPVGSVVGSKQYTALTFATKEYSMHIGGVVLVWNSLVRMIPCIKLIVLICNCTHLFV